MGNGCCSFEGHHTVLLELLSNVCDLCFQCMFHSYHKKVMNVCVCIFFQGKLVTLIIPYPHPTVFCFNPRRLGASFFPLGRRQTGITINTQLHPWITVVSAFSDVLPFSLECCSPVHIDPSPPFRL